MFPLHKCTANQTTLKKWENQNSQQQKITEQKQRCFWDPLNIYVKNSITIV